MEDNLKYLAQLYGIELAYTDSSGIRREASEDTICKILSGMGVNASSWEETEKSIKHFLVTQAEQGIAPTLSYKVGHDHLTTEFTARSSDPWHILSWIITEEDNKTSYSGFFKREHLNVSREFELWGEKWQVFELYFPVSLSMGYHTLTVKGFGSDANPTTSYIIVSPHKCYLPENLANGWRSWGVQTQLFRLKRKDDWGIGDFTSLKKLAQSLGELGSDFITLSPLHDLDVRDLRGQNPFYPTDRFALNILYIDLNAIPELKESDELQKLLNSNIVINKIKKLKEGDEIDYRGVLNLKLSILERFHNIFEEHHLLKQTERANKFQEFLKSSPDIEQYAIFQALKEYFEQLKFTGTGWRYWEERFHNPDNPVVKEFSDKYRDKVNFFKYVQWVAYEQLESTYKSIKDAGLKLGLFQSLATTPRSSSSESWNNQDSYASNIYLGEPPSLSEPNGINTRLCCWNPINLQKNHFKTFIRVLRQTMKYSDGIRLGKYALSSKLYWIPDKSTPDDGAYVKYPIDDILGIIALESVRNKCIIATDPPASGSVSLKELNILERQFYLDPKDDTPYENSWEIDRQIALATVDHYMPSIKNFWMGNDITEELNFRNP